MRNYSDVFIVGGGINGAAIAADAAGRGLSVTLCEKNDLASGTSSASSKLIHGGLRYLEQFEFNLVRKGLRERRILLNRAPFLITPLEFIFPHEKHLRPAWLIRLGLFLYDHLSLKNNLPSTQGINLTKDARGKPLLAHIKQGFSFYDGFTDDARLVILNALLARDYGALILTRTTFIKATREKNFWKIHLFNQKKQIEEEYYARVLINVAGPWIQKVHQHISSNLQFKINFSKGSHLIVPKMYEGNHAYILQTEDKRVTFIIPFKEHWTLVGTTDVNFKGNLDEIHIQDTEINYLCNIINRYFKKAIHKKDIVWTYSGVRCLQSSDETRLSEITRDYRILVEDRNTLPLLTIIGGKLTMHRALAEETINQLKPYFKTLSPPFTATKPLPGGNFKNQSYKEFKFTFKKIFTFLPSTLCDRYLQSYGTRSLSILQNAKTLDDLGEHFGRDLYQIEVDYLIKEEWAKTAEDILWRRSKLGLLFTRSEQEKLTDYLQTKI